MSLTATRARPAARRLPGIRFDVSAPPPAEVLPRMDIAGFVGIAASGPINVPVAVEDPAAFAEIFGADAPIAWDPARSQPAFAQLAPAVRAFFGNGGRRCWVVRVAGAGAQADSFQIPGIAAVAQDGTIGPATLLARSRGSWADGLQVAASVESQPLGVQWSPARPDGVRVGASGAADVAPGDLLRITFTATALLLVAGSVAPALADDGSAVVDVVAASRRWVSPAPIPEASVVRVRHLGPDGAGAEALARATAASPPGGLTRLDFDAPVAQAPAAGALVTGEIDGVVLLLEVVQVQATSAGVTALVCSAVRAQEQPPAAPGDPEPFGERLTLRLAVDGAPGGPATLGGLGFAPAHPLYAGALPADEALYAGADAPPVAAALAAAVTNPRFVLAGPLRNPWAPDSGPVDWCFPLEATLGAGAALGATWGAGTTRVRDGLVGFGAGLFVDPALSAVPADALLETARWLRYERPSLAEAPAFAGIHALLENDEVTLLAVPDAVLPGWSLEMAPPAPPPDPPAPAPQPDWSRFLACSTRVPSAPWLSLAGRPGGVIQVSWSATDAPGAAYELQSSSDPGFAGAEGLYVGPGLEIDLARPPQGATVYLRVRALAGGLASAWSAALTVDVASAERWLLDDPAMYDPAALLAVQGAALRMCAARGDLLAVLAMPEHYRARDAIAHAEYLIRTLSAGAGTVVDPSLGFGALYHPWLYTAEPDDPTAIRRTAPDGAAAGVAAQRAAGRGAWIAPANEPLAGVVALDEPVGADSYQALLDAQVNVVRQEPAGFLTLSADTLARDPDLRPISTRRLLALLRRTALRYGDASAFATNDEQIRRTVIRAFQSLLGRMFSLGAFAGATAGEGFQVDAPLDAADLEAGRLVVELRVAPARPLSFLTVRLVRSGSGGLTVEAR